MATFIGSADVGGGKISAVNMAAADILVARFGSDGSHVWSKGRGARSDALLPSIAIDGEGSLLLTATYDGSFSMGGAIFTSDGATDVGVAKWDKDGIHQWSYRFAGPDYDLSDGIAADRQGNVIVVGHYKGNSHMSGGAYMKSYGSYDGWVAKLAPSGQFLWSQHYGGIGDDSVADVATDAQGNIWLAGQFTAAGELGRGPMNVVDGIDGFLIKLAPATPPKATKTAPKRAQTLLACRHTPGICCADFYERAVGRDERSRQGSARRQRVAGATVWCRQWCGARWRAARRVPSSIATVVRGCRACWGRSTACVYTCSRAVRRRFWPCTAPSTRQLSSSAAS